MTAATVGGLRPGDHVCWTFAEDGQRRGLVAELVAAGLAAGEQVLCFTEDPDPAMAEAVEAGALRLTSAEESYLADGEFDPGAMLAGWRAELDRARREGHPGLRVVADMSWAARPGRLRGLERLAWYEAQASRVFADGYATVVCLYDQRLFPRRELDGIASAHPATVAAQTGAGAGWRPQLRMLRTSEPAGLRLAGESDLATQGALAAVLDGLPEDLPVADRPVTVDVAELSFADVEAVYGLVRAARRAPAGLRLIGASRTLVDLLHLVAGREPPGMTVEAADEGAR